MEIPPISGDAVSKGKWSVYAQCDPEEDEPDVGPMMRSRGALDTRRKGDLIFSDLPPLPHALGHVDDEFGRPVPGWVFGGRRHQAWVNDAPSIWMYQREKASRSRVGERYSPPTPQMVSPALEDLPTGTNTFGIIIRVNSPSEGSVVSLGPEEDVVMEDVGTRESPEKDRSWGNSHRDGTTYVLIHASGIYRLLQSDYRVDYFFEVRDARNAEVLLRAGEGARDRREQASEAKEKVKLPSFKKTVPLRVLSLPERNDSTKPQASTFALSFTPTETNGCVGKVPPLLGLGIARPEFIFTSVPRLAMIARTTFQSVISRTESFASIFSRG
ncbi:hypothetical protein B0H14DRAFT_3524327 [Mycena olivaceomarginata]|nr:hypothetical protein B0H14DRAFT_3524327 [Mycena olivaceomarginata]